MVVRKVSFLVLLGVERIRSIVSVRKVPIRLKDFHQSLDNGFLSDRRAKFAAQIEGAAIDIH